ncbi:hypothetical protein Nepgr_020561 [Nepenthes gracilis]|uniref:Uncharacterized protein n=1 Tax=Nepenthes gracilis TaxID=150966 RepID=A0AAD3XWD8_NEPGR|nr:hypothetical protein Nepgr_020561 [Nepenthes gracilis]
MGWAPGAKLAASVGGFNNGNPNAKVLTRDEIGVWKTLLPNETAGSASTPHDSVDEANVFSHLQPNRSKSPRIPATKLFTKPSKKTPSKSAQLTVDHAGAPTAPLTSPAKLYPSMVEEQKLPKIRVNSIEDEVWNLLHKSLVFYCGNPVGTLAVNDLSSVNILNYDWSWEKTLDCYNPGQGLMPASFKVRVVLLDSDDSVTKKILDIHLSSRSGTPENFESLADKAHSVGLRVLRDVIHNHTNNNITDGLNGFDVRHPSFIRWRSWMPTSSSLNIMFRVIAMFARESW